MSMFTRYTVCLDGEEREEGGVGPRETNKKADVHVF